MADGNPNVAPVIQHINSNLRLPGELNILTGNVAENFKTWKRSVEVYLMASGINNMDNAIQTATIINCGGESVLKIYDHFDWGDKDKNNPTDVFEKIEEYCNPRQNEVAESHKFWTVRYFEPFDQFLTELKSKANSCNFGDKEDRMIRDKIVFSTTGKMQQLLLRDDNLDLKKAIKICQSYEQANKQAQEMKEDHEPKVHKMKTNKPKSNEKKERNFQKKTPNTKNEREKNKVMQILWYQTRYEKR